MNIMQNQVVVITFYKFVKLPDFRAIQKPLLIFCKENGIFGTILLAEEGINSTVAGSREGIESLLDYLGSDERFADLKVKTSYTDTMPFGKMKVRLKREIVTLKQDVDPNELVGTYIDPQDWNNIISDPDVILIDTRNDFETQIGTFKGAINPETDAFSELPDFVEKNLDPQKHKKVAMFCTGGIRCEKATSYMLKQGFETVYHLNGGILRYLEEVDPEQSLWEGECFVFDERVSVDHHLQAGQATFCADCKTLLKMSDEACHACGSVTHMEEELI